MTQPCIAVITLFEDILDELEALARDHLLFYGVQVGNVLLQHLGSAPGVR